MVQNNNLMCKINAKQSSGVSKIARFQDFQDFKMLASHDSTMLEVGHATCKAFNVFFIIMKILRKRSYDTYVLCYQDY